jgi:hypothetical protein
MIQVPHGNSFDENDLIKHIENSGRNYIIQGQQNYSFESHAKKNSLDYWLRSRDVENKDTKLADNYVLAALAATGRFRVVENLICPDSGRLCKGVELIEDTNLVENPSANS